MKITGKGIAIAAATATLLGLGGAVYAAGSSRHQGGMPFMRGMMFWSLDRNEDGFIDRGEIDGFRTRMFERLDTDGNGNFTEEEMKAHHADRHGRGNGRHEGTRMGHGMPGRGMPGHGGQRHGAGGSADGMMFWFLDRDENGYVERAEIDAFRTKKFEKLDADGDGTITREDMKARAEHSRGNRHSGGGRFERTFENADANDDDAVTLDEFLATPPRMFEHADADNDGRVSEAEAKDARRPRGERMFARADANNDGTVTLEEFLATEPPMFARADNNGDGKVSEAEAKDLMSNMRRLHHGNDMD